MDKNIAIDAVAEAAAELEAFACDAEVEIEAVAEVQLDSQC